MRTHIYAFLAITLASCSTLQAKDVSWTPLFDGKTLKGWANPYDHGESTVVDGEIHLVADKKFFLCTENTYTNFIFEGEIKLPEGPANSGFMFRCHVEPNKVYGYQAEVDPTDRAWSGGLYDEARRQWLNPLKPDDSPSADAFREKTKGALKRHDWNHFKIQAEGNRLRIWVNGMLCTDYTDDMDAQGHIGIQHHGEKGQVYKFRNLRIQELPASSSNADKKLTPVPVWTDAQTAVQEVTEFPMVGEYVSADEKTALQANLLKDGTFLVAIYQNGLPGDGWDQSAIESKKLTAAELKQLLSSYQKIERVSTTLGKPAPADAVLTLPDGFTNVEDGILMAGGKTAKDLESFHMHLEYLMPFKPARNPSNQDRGNSGIYIFNNYEVQVIDSFGLDLDSENNAINPESLNSQWCGSLYKMKTPDVHMAYPPLRWQTYDIDFTAPEFDGDTKIKNARLTVFHNGVLIHDDVELPTGTGAGAERPQLATGPVFFQDHANPVIYRNVWVTELDE
ncbi:DUF1080 domain-containing protein [Pontiellaceae bacterium B1224]|nr:DUF1080 domain-containing protein [Pontiellaceae bacterium B1224]